MRAGPGFLKDCSVYRLFSQRDPCARQPAAASSVDLPVEQLVGSRPVRVEPYAFHIQSNGTLVAFELKKAKTHKIVDLGKQIAKTYRIVNSRFRDLDYRPKPGTARGDFWFLLRLRRDERVALLFLLGNMGDILLSAGD